MTSIVMSSKHLIPWLVAIVTIGGCASCSPFEQQEEYRRRMHDMNWQARGSSRHEEARVEAAQRIHDSVYQDGTLLEDLLLMFFE